MKATIFRHAAYSSLGSLSAVLEKAGMEYRYIDLYREESPDFDPYDPDLLIVLGGSMGVYDVDEFLFLKYEIDILEKRLAEDLPTLGICLGAQLIAKALGSDVFLGEQGREQGWHPLRVLEEGQKTAIRHFDSRHTNMLHWHGDTFDLPEGTTLLASSDQYENQIFCYGENTMAFQCHAEGTADMLQKWLNKFPDKDKHLKKIIQETEQYGENLITRTEKFFLEWVEQLKENGEENA